MIDSPSSGERKGKSLNTPECKRCSVAGCGLWDFLLGGATRPRLSRSAVEPVWKAGP